MEKARKSGQDLQWTNRSGLLEHRKPEDFLKKHFRDWIIVNLSYPLRTSKTLSEEIIHHYEQITGPLANIFNPVLKVPDNMPLGPPPLILTKGSIEERFKRVFNYVGNDKRALIIISDANMSIPPDEEEAAMKTAFYNKMEKNLLEGTGGLWDERSENQRRINMVSVVVEALNACDRQLLFWLVSDESLTSDDKEKIMRWDAGSERIDLITDDAGIAGYEVPFLILVGDDHSINMTTYMSRCKGQFVHIHRHILPNSYSDYPANGMTIEYRFHIL